MLEDGTLAGKPVLLGADRRAPPGTRWRWSSRCGRCSPTCAPTSSPTAVFAASEDFGATGPAGGLAGERVDRAGRELADAVRRRPASAPVDPFENPTPFADLLGH